MGWLDSGSLRGIPYSDSPYLNGKNDVWYFEIKILVHSFDLYEFGQCTLSIADVLFSSINGYLERSRINRLKESGSWNFTKEQLNVSRLCQG